MPLSFSRWVSGEPNDDAQHGEDCVSVHVRNTDSATNNWNDIPCDYQFGVICEKRV